MRCDERLDLRRLEVVDRDRDPVAAGGVDELGGLLDRLRPVVLRAPLPGRAAGAVDRRARLSQRDRRAAPGTAGRARHERHLACQRTRHRVILGSRRRGDRGSGRRAGREREHRDQHERAAGELHGAERLAEHHERQRRR